MKDKLQIGQKVWVQPTGNMARKGSDTSLREATVNTIEKKYFMLKEYPRIKFDLSNGKHVSDIFPNYKVWLSQEEYEQYLEKSKLGQELKRWFSDKYGELPLSLDQIKRILDILNEEK